MTKRSVLHGLLCAAVLWFTFTLAVLAEWLLGMALGFKAWWWEYPLWFAVGWFVGGELLVNVEVQGND